MTAGIQIRGSSTWGFQRGTENIWLGNKFTQLSRKAEQHSVSPGVTNSEGAAPLGAVLGAGQGSSSTKSQTWTWNIWTRGLHFLGLAKACSRGTHYKY